MMKMNDYDYDDEEWWWWRWRMTTNDDDEWWWWRMTVIMMKMNDDDDEDEQWWWWRCRMKMSDDDEWWRWMDGRRLGEERAAKDIPHPALYGWRGRLGEERAAKDIPCPASKGWGHRIRSAVAPAAAVQAATFKPRCMKIGNSPSTHEDQFIISDSKSQYASRSVYIISFSESPFSERMKISS